MSKASVRQPTTAPWWTFSRLLKHSMSRRGASVLRVLLLVVVVSGLGTEASVEAQTSSSEMVLTTPVRQTLQRVQEDWEAWQRAYFQNDRDGAEAARTSLQTLLADLGMYRLPELASAAAAYARRSAEAGNFTRADWALEDARALDETRPEVDFAAAAIYWREGDYLRSLISTVAAYGRLLRLASARTALLNNGVIWLLFVLMAAGALFVATQMAVKGADVLEDLRRPLSSWPLPAALLLAFGVLTWPLLLPHGLLWMLLFWAVLLFGYASISERVVLTLLLIAIGVVPLIVRQQQRAMDIATSPPTRLLAALENGRLYSSLFSDLEVLRGLMPNHPAVIEVTADLHRRLGQWELARLRYGALAELEPANGAALNNLGVYHIRKQDFRSAKGYLERAGEVEPGLVEPFFNLSQAFSSSYDFGESHEALAQAQKIDRARVDAWLEGGDNDLAIPVEGSARRYGEIRRELVARGRVDAMPTGLEWLRRELTLSVTSALLLAAVALHVLRRRFGYTTRIRLSRRSNSVWARLLRALIPGWHSAEEGHGGRGFGLALLVVALVALPLLSRLRYQLPIDGELATWPLLVVALLGLMALIMVRVGHEFTAGGRR